MFPCRQSLHCKTLSRSVFLVQVKNARADKRNIWREGENGDKCEARALCTLKKPILSIERKKKPSCFLVSTKPCPVQTAFVPMNSSFTLFLQLNLKMLGVITEISFLQAPHLPSQAMSTRPILILTSLFQALSTKEECRVKLEDGYSFHKVQCTINFFTVYTEFRMFYSSKKIRVLDSFHFFSLSYITCIRW